MYNDFGALAGLRADVRTNSESSKREVAEQFEALFVQMMMKSMRDAVPEGGLFDSHQLDNYQQMHDQQLAMDMATQGGIGLADVIMSQFETRSGANDAKPITDFNALSEFRVASLPTIRPKVEMAIKEVVGDSAQDLDWDASSPEAFLRSLEAPAKKAAAELGVDSDVLLAQAALETGWGQHVVSSGGALSNNLFNIKASNDWDGAVMRQQTLEYRDGVAVRESADFRAYSSVQEAFDDYVDFVKSSPRYQDAVAKAADGEQYVRELQKAGYATDPVYADKVLAVRDRIADSVSELALKTSRPVPLTD